MFKKASLLVLVVILCAYLPAFSLIQEGSSAPDFTLADINGVSHTLSDYAGNVVMIDLYNVLCGPCNEEAAFFENLYQDYKAQGFVIFTIDIDNTDDNLDDVKNYTEQYGFTFPSFWDESGIIPPLFDYNGNMPTTIIIGKDQKVFKAMDNGFHDQTEFSTLISNALNPEPEKTGIVVSTDKDKYVMKQDKMEVFLSCVNPGEALTVDIILALYHIPTGSIEGNLWFFPDWRSGLQTIRLTLPAAFQLPTTSILKINVPSLVPGTPPVIENGEYTWAAALAKPGTLEFYSMSTKTVTVIDNTVPTFVPQIPTEKPIITVSTDKKEYEMNNDSMQVYLEASNPGESFVAVDIIFALYHVPAGSLEGKLWFFPNWTQKLSVINVQLPPQFMLNKTQVLKVAVPSLIPSTPPVIEPGEYIWAVGLTKPGTVEFLNDISTAPVLVKDPSIPSHAPQTFDPTVKVSTDKLEYILNQDKMKVYLEVLNPGAAITVDVIFALYHVPTGSLEGKLWFFPDWRQGYTATRVPIPGSFSLPSTLVVQINVPSLVPGTPAVIEAGEYTWAAAFARPGTLNFIGNISTAIVNVKNSAIPTY
jgi:peroxiredoxin